MLISMFLFGSLLVGPAYASEACNGDDDIFEITEKLKRDLGQEIIFYGRLNSGLGVVITINPNTSGWVVLQFVPPNACIVVEPMIGSDGQFISPATGVTPGSAS